MRVLHIEFLQRLVGSGIVAVAVAFAVGSTTSCRAIKPYEKEYLLDPTMDDARVERISAPYGKTRRPNERLAAAGGSAGSTSCPTCGGK